MKFYTWIHEDKDKTKQQWKEHFNFLKESGFETIFLGGDFDFLQNSSPLAKETGLYIGHIHFSPFPRIDFPKSKASLSAPPIPSTVKQFEVGFAEGNYPDFFETLWALVQQEFQMGSNR